MRWEKIPEEPGGAKVVRALSFSARAEDGSLLSIPARQPTGIHSQPSFTSIDVKKSRRVARRISLKPPKSTMIPMQSSTPLGTQSLERPSRVNKLILRVPSIASEYEHKRVIHSQVTEDSISSPPLVSQAVQTNLGGFDNFRSDDAVEFSRDQGVYTIPQRSEGGQQWRVLGSEQWRNSDSASACLSNLSSGDGLSSSTISRLSHHMNYDGLSTSTHMGSTTRLVQKPKNRERCTKCLGREQVTTAFAILSFAGTLGNLLRLPRLVYFHGGGVFLLIYILVTLVFGIPITFLEIGLGQFCQHGVVKLWRAVNLFRGVGYAKVVLSFLLAVSYSTQIASALSLLVLSVNDPGDCQMQNTAKDLRNETWKQNCMFDTVLSPASEEPAWFGVRLLFTLLTWTLVLICLMKRSTTYRKINYFLFPAFFVILIGLLFEGSNQPGADLDKLRTTDWTAFGDIEVWYLAIVQVFFSIQVGFGNLNTCAGRIYPKSNAIWTAISLVLTNLFIGILCVLLVHYWEASVPIATKSSQTFVLNVIYNKITSVSTAWVCSAYILVLIAGLSSLVGLIYTVLVAGAIETKRRVKWRYINGSVCAVGLFLAILSLTPGWMEVSEAIEDYGISRAVIALTILELVALAGIYGCGNLYNDLEFVIGVKLSRAWKSLWLLTPIVLTVMELTSAVLLPAVKYPNSLWQAALGWTIYTACWLIVLATAVYQIYQQVDYNLAQKIVSAAKPSRNWGPVDPIYRHCWVQWRNRYNLTGTRDFTLKRRGTRDYTHHARTGTPTKTDTLPWQISVN